MDELAAFGVVPLDLGATCFLGGVMCGLEEGVAERRRDDTDFALVAVPERVTLAPELVPDWPVLAVAAAC